MIEIKKSISQKLRMDGRDYALPGWYFVTMGADYHRHFFGEVDKAGRMQPNALGQLVDTCWAQIPSHYGHIALGAWQVMPNHFHGIVRITQPGGKGLGEVMNVFKGAVTRQWRRSGGVISRYSGIEQQKVWAPNYYDVICFDEQELDIRENYVRANPRRWALRDVPQGILGESRYKGNAGLLRMNAPRRALRVSRKATAAEVAALQAEFARFDGIVCSTFFSPGERACLQGLQSGKTRIIWVQPMAMPASIPVNWTMPFLEKRALWLSAFPDDQPDATRETCQMANRRVETLCAAPLKPAHSTLNRHQP